MRKSLRVVALLIPLVLVSSNSYAAVKAGSACSKAGSKSVSGGKSYTCVKSGKKFVWNKGVGVTSQKPIPNSPANEPLASGTSEQANVGNAKSTFGFDSPCDFDNAAPKEWLEIQNYFHNNEHCLGPVRIIPVTLTSLRPVNKESSPSKLLGVDQCKITAPDNFNILRGWPSNFQLKSRNLADRIHPSPNTVIQIISFYTSDSAQPARSPSEDYGMYFDFLREVVKYNSDNGSNFQIKVPGQYVRLQKSLAEYGVTHEGGSAEQDSKRQVFANDLVNAVNQDINFAGTNLVIAVAPPGTSLNLSVVGSLWDVKADGQNLILGTASPYTITRPMFNHAPSISPMWWWHELFHIGIGLADHNGNNYWQNHFGNDPTKPGMGNWGLMSMAITDLLALEKWTLGFISDQQVRCVDAKEATTHWISPSTAKSKETKLVAIPLSKTESILIESQRAAGLNFMLSHESEGALVYHLNTAEPDREFGLEVLTIDGYKVKADPFVLSDATLKAGQHVDFKGIRISVIESGAFGDVIKVEKVA